MRLMWFWVGDFLNSVVNLYLCSQREELQYYRRIPISPSHRVRIASFSTIVNLTIDKFVRTGSFESIDCGSGVIHFLSRQGGLSRSRDIPGRRRPRRLSRKIDTTVDVG